MKILHTSHSFSKANQSDFRDTLVQVKNRLVRLFSIKQSCSLIQLNECQNYWRNDVNSNTSAMVLIISDVDYLKDYFYSVVSKFVYTSKYGILLYIYRGLTPLSAKLPSHFYKIPAILRYVFVMEMSTRTFEFDILIFM